MGQQKTLLHAALGLKYLTTLKSSPNKPNQGNSDSWPGVMAEASRGVVFSGLLAPLLAPLQVMKQFWLLKQLRHRCGSCCHVLLPAYGRPPTPAQYSKQVLPAVGPAHKI